MDNQQLTVIVAVGLFVAVLVGWGLRWIFDLLNPPPPPEPVADSEWAEYAKACEAAREAAETALAEMERDLGNRLSQANAERDAAMEGLGDARRQTQELQSELDRLKSGAA